MQMVSSTSMLTRVVDSIDLVPSLMSVLVRELAVVDAKGIRHLREFNVHHRHLDAESSPGTSLHSVLLNICSLMAPHCTLFPKCFFELCVQVLSTSLYDSTCVLYFQTVSNNQLETE